MGQRIVTGIIGVIAAFAVAWFSSDSFFWFVVFAVYLLAAVEFAAIVDKVTASFPKVFFLVTLTVASVLLTYILSKEKITAYTILAYLVLVVVCGAIGGILVVRVSDNTNKYNLFLIRILNGAVLSFALVWLSLPIATTWLVWKSGFWQLFLLCAIVWVGDSTAFFIGRKWGKRQFASTLSPKKTWEGAIASFVTSLIVGSVWNFFFEDSFVKILFVSAMTSIAAQIGDLLESLFKRAALVKDSGFILPGHGGMLDRMDALILASPIFYFLSVLVS